MVILPIDKGPLLCYIIITARDKSPEERKDNKDMTTFRYKSHTIGLIEFEGTTEVYFRREGYPFTYGFGVLEKNFKKVERLAMAWIDAGNTEYLFEEE